MFQIRLPALTPTLSQRERGSNRRNAHQAMVMSWALPPAAAVLVLIDCSCTSAARS